MGTRERERQRHRREGEERVANSGSRVKERVRDASGLVRERVSARVSILHIYTATWCRAKLGRDGLFVGSAILIEAGRPPPKMRVLLEAGLFF